MKDPRRRFRTACLALPEAVEVQAWGDPTYRVRNKIFAMEKGAGAEIWCKGAPGEQAALVAADPGRYFVPPYVGHRGWIGVKLDAGTDWQQLSELIADSYRMTAPKKLVARLHDGG